MTNNSRVLGRPGDELMLYRMVPVIGTLRCKPLVQCHDQCRVLCAVPNLRPIRERGVLYIDALCEYNCGILENKSEDESWRLHHDIAEDWIRHKHWHRKPDQSESFVDISNRFLPFIAHLTHDRSWTDSHIALIGHGGLFRLMLPLVLTNIDQQFVHEHGIGHTTCIIAESHPEGLQCVQWGEVRWQHREEQPILEWPCL